MSYCSCACVRVLSCKAAAPLLKSTLIFPIFTIAPPFSLPARVRVRACIVRVCRVVVQWWYVAMCFCVSVFCVFSPPCAPWLTIQRYAQKAEFVRVSFCVPLCSFTSPRRAPWGTLHRSILFTTVCRQCEMCTTYRAIGGYGVVCVLSVFCFPGRAPGG